jgi:hypothetical protein
VSPAHLGNNEADALIAAGSKLGVTSLTTCIIICLLGGERNGARQKMAQKMYMDRARGGPLTKSRLTTDGIAFRSAVTQLVGQRSIKKYYGWRLGQLGPSPTNMLADVMLATKALKERGTEQIGPVQAQSQNPIFNRRLFLFNTEHSRAMLQETQL